MKARSIARELALLGISQLTDNPKAIFQPAQGFSAQQQDALLTKALTLLSADAQEAIEVAEGELQRGERLILENETRTVGADEVRWRGDRPESNIQPVIPLVEAAINRVGGTLDLLIFVQQSDRQAVVAAQKTLSVAAQRLAQGDQLLLDNALRVADISLAREEIQGAISAVRTAARELKASLTPANFASFIDRSEIRSYACDLLENWINHWHDIDHRLDAAMEKWNIRRLARVDRDILRLAMIEIIYRNVPKKVAIDEAIEMAKRYSDEEGYRFINGVLRRATDKLEAGGDE
jgi:transcription antitermination protein NusB